MFLSVDFLYSVYSCPVETSRMSILLLWSFYTLFTLCPFETKRGSICLIWTGLVCLTCHVIFVLEWPKGEFVSFLYWLHSVGQNHYHVLLLISQGCCINSESSNIQSLFL
jgi:hypothetical protein